MKIAVLMHDFTPKSGGAEVNTYGLATHLSRLGHQVTVFSNQKYVKQCDSKGMRFGFSHESISLPHPIFYNLSGLWIRNLARPVIEALKRTSADIVHIIVAWPWLPIVPEIKKQLGIPVVLRCAGDDIQINEKMNYGIRRDPKVRKLLDRGFAAIDHCIAISPTVTKEYLKVGVAEKKISQIFPGVDIGAFEKYEISKNVAKKQLGINEAKKVILSVGRNHPKKRFRDLLQIIKKLKETSQDYMIVVIGHGCDSLMDAVNSMNLNDHVMALPEMSNKVAMHGESIPSQELIAHYRAADYFLMPSEIETFGNVKLEAMAAGLPVIVSDGPGCSDFIDDGLNGFVVPVGDVGQYVNRILYLDENPTKKEQIIASALKKTILQDWPVVARQHADLYRRLISQISTKNIQIKEMVGK